MSALADHLRTFQAAADEFYSAIHEARRCGSAEAVLAQLDIERDGYWDTAEDQLLALIVEIGKWS